MSLWATANHTVGPYFHIGMAWACNVDMAPAGTPGRRVEIAGQVLDGAGRPVADALLEIWQANAAGRYAHPDDHRALPLDPAFRGFGRVATDREGRFRVLTIKPGAVPAADGSMQAPHLAITLFMRGLLRHLYTRVYFPEDDPVRFDPVLALVPVERRGSLVARAAGDARFEWNVNLQGEAETVFFDL